MVKLFAKLLLPLAMVAVTAAGRAEAQEKGTGPTSLVITYTSTAQHRAAFRDYLEREALPQFDRWKSEGVFKEYQLLFSWFSGSNTWDAMVVLDFARYADIARWKAVDRKSPGGLSPAGLVLASPSSAYLADPVWHKEAADRNPDKAVYFVVPYQYSSVGEYKAYAQAYVLPQFDGWIKDGALAGYTVYLSHHTASKPWDALIVQEYRDIDGIARRELVKNKVRAELSSNPEWKKASDGKEGRRTEEEITIADAIRR